MATIAVRTVRNGTVRIKGRRFSPETHHEPYDGRLDNLRFAFALYRDYETGGWKPLAALWGTEAAYRGQEPQMQGPEVVDGSLPWYFWHAEQVDASTSP
mgnify:CR=1 FL=1